MSNLRCVVSVFRTFAFTLPLLAACRGAAQQIQYSSAHRESELALPQTTAPVRDAILQAKLAARTGTSLVIADFDADGTPDLISGYATPAGGVLLLQRGSPKAHAPGPEEWALTAARQLVSPFVERAEPIDLPVRPDLLRTADVEGRGHPGLLVAALGDSSVYVLFGFGNGTFSAPRALPLSGSISSLATWQGRDGQTLIVAGVRGLGGASGSSGCGLQFLDNTGQTRAFVSTANPVTSIASGRLNNSSGLDLALVSGGRPMVLDGDSVLSPSPTLEKLPVAGISALALGSFVTDRRGMLQIALLGTDATLHVFTRSGLDTSVPSAAELAFPRRGHPLKPKSRSQQPAAKLTGQPWSEVETIAGAGPGGTSPILLRAHLLGSGNDDLAILAGTQYITVAHRKSVVDGQNKTIPVLTVDSTGSDVLAALPARVTADPRHGILILSRGPKPLTVSMPATYKTYTVNTTADGDDSLTSTGRCTGTGTCTLRDAANLVNVDSPHNISAGTIDIISLPAGTYTFSVDNPTKGTTTPASFDLYGSYNYHLELDGPFSLQGAGSASTIINANSLDQIMTINGGAYYTTGKTDYTSLDFDGFVSGVTLENAVNRNTSTDSTCATYQYCTLSGGAISWTANGDSASNLVLNNMAVTSSQDGAAGSGGDGGGGIAAFGNSTSTLNGPLEIDNSTFSSNSDRDGGGGGAIAATSQLPIILTDDIITNNTSAVGGGAGEGGGVIVDNYQTTPVTPITITGTTISGNTASGGFGGGIYLVGNINISTSTIGGNTASSFGGGLYAEEYPYTGTATITSTNFFSNKLVGTVYNSSSGLTELQDGSAVCVDANGSGSTQSPIVNITYSRFFNNTGDTNGDTVSGGCNDGDKDGNGNTVANYSTVNATNDWWGCQAGANSTNCGTARTGNANDGTITLTPYTVLALTTNTPILSGNTITATGGLYSNSEGTTYTPTAQTAGFSGTAASITITQNGGSNSTSNGTLNTSGTYAGSVTAAHTGSSSASITVDNAIVSAVFTVTGTATLTAASSHSGNFKAGDAADTYTLLIGNSTATATSGTVTVVDTLPSGFTATALTGSGWTCSLGSLTCTRSDALTNGSYPVITLTVGISGSDAGAYTNSVTASGGGSPNSATGTDSTNVVAPPTITESFSPTTITVNENSVVTFQVGSPAANPVSLTGVAFTDALPSGLKNASVTGAHTTCSGGTVTAAGSGTTISLSGATVAAGSTCTVFVSVTSSTPAGYTNVTGNVTATNSNPGGTASALLTVTPIELAYTASPASPISRNGNAGTITVSLEDEYGDVETTYNGVSITVTVTGPNGYSQPYTSSTASGVATFNLSSVALPASGTYTYTATGSGYTSATATEVVSADPTTTAVAALTSNTGTVGGSMTISATVTDNNVSSPSIGSPTGTVTFYNTVGGATTTIGTTNLSGGTASITYSESYGGSNVITATYTPSSGSFATSSDATGRTITVAKATPVQAIGAETIRRNISSEISLIFSYSGQVPPSGAIAVSINGVATGVTPTCTYKVTGPSPHANCSLMYTTTLAVGTYTLTYTQAADSNYNMTSGSAMVTVTN